MTTERMRPERRKGRGPKVGPRRLTPLEQEVLRVAAREGFLVELRGGYWSFYGVKVVGGVPVWWVGLGTVLSLVDRGLLRWVTDRKVERVEQDGD